MMTYLAFDPQNRYVLLPSKYQEFQDVFDKVKVIGTLREHHHSDYTIDLQPGKEPP
jgi:hypothetical protein